jgi:endonuclease YncB( thermonuclease family)
VFIGGANLSLEQLRRGAAMLPANPKYVRDPESAKAEAAARQARLGL